MTPKKDDSQDIVMRIMNQPVPSKGQLVNPIHAAKTERKRKQYALNDASSRNDRIPDDPKQWKPKHFVDYFANKYQDYTGANYRKVYASDIMLFQRMGDFLVSNGLERNTWTKKLIDWSFKHRDEIIRLEGHFTPQEVLRRINHFYQDQVLPQVEDGDIERDTQDTVLLEEIQKADAEGRITEVFSRFGIPVTVTYLAKSKGWEEDKILKAVEERVKLLSNGSMSDKEQLIKMIHASIVGSPYPVEFLALNWRDNLKLYLKFVMKEQWWRDNDYKGKPLPKYYSLI